MQQHTNLQAKTDNGKRFLIREWKKQTLGSVTVAYGKPVTTTALPAWSAKSNPSLTC